VNTVEREILLLIGEDLSSPDVFTDDNTGMAPIRDSVNAAIQEISLVTGVNRESVQLALRQGRNFYKLRAPRGYPLWITSAWLRGVKRKLEQVSLGWLNDYNPRWLYNSGNPERYVQIGSDVVCLHPAPASDSGVVEVEMAIAPEAYTSDTDRIKLRDEHKKAVVHYAVSEYWAGRGDAKLATYHFNEYLIRTQVQRLYPATPERHWHYQTKKRGESDWRPGANS